MLKQHLGSLSRFAVNTVVGMACPAERQGICHVSWPSEVMYSSEGKALSMVTAHAALC